MKLKIKDGEQQYNEINKRSYRDEEQVMRGYIEREGYDCHANTLKELVEIKKNANEIIERLLS